MLPRICTHSGRLDCSLDPLFSFHADEALAVFMLKCLPEYAAATIVRTRDPQIIEQSTIVVDVGGVYQPEKLRFDHHQRSFTETFSPSHTITRLSSAGLIYKHYGKRVIQTLLDAVPPTTLELIYQKVYNEFIEGMDAIDNGVNQYPNAQPLYKNKTDLSSRVGRLNPAWNEEHVDVDQQFLKAVAMTGEEFSQVVKYIGTSWLPARSIVEQSLLNRFKVDASGRIMVMEQYAPWKEHLDELETHHAIPPEQLPFYVIYQDGSGQWRVQAVSVFPGSFESRKALPEAWRGLRDDELSVMAAIPDMVFVHATGFIGGAKSLSVLAMAKHALLILWLLVGLSLVSALFQDQAGVIDWHKPLLGIPQQIHWDKQLIVSTHFHLASLNSTDGSILWRHVLSEPLLSTWTIGKSVFSVSGDESQLWIRKFEIPDGSLEWEVSLNGSKKPLIRWLDKSVVLLNELYLFQLDFKDGKILSKMELGIQPMDVFHDSGLIVIGMTASGSLAVQKDNATPVIVFENRVKRAFFIKESPTVVWEDLNGKVTIKSLSSDFVKDLGEGNLQQLFEHAHFPHFIITLAQKTLVYTIEKENVYSTTLNGQPILQGDIVKGRTVIYQSSPSSVSVKDPKTLKTIQKIPVSVNTLKTGNIFNVKWSNTGEILVQFKDGSLQKHSNGQVVWNREEFLANVDSSFVLFIDFPESGAASLTHDELDEPLEMSEKLNPWQRYKLRLDTHIKKLSKLFNEKEFFKSPPSANATSLVKDHFGFKQLLIVLSKNGKLTALNTLDGSILWELYLPEEWKILDSAQLTMKHLFLAREALIKSPPLVFIVSEIDSNDGTRTTLVYRVDALTGRPDTDSKQAFEMNVESVFRLPVMETAGYTHPLVLTFVNQTKVQLFPNTPESLIALNEYTKEKGLFYYQQEENMMRGYQIVKVSDIEFQSQPKWTFKPLEGEHIVNIAKDSCGKVASVARVLGNRSVLYKYLNPNLITVATSRIRNGTFTSFIYLLDTVTGSIYERMILRGVAKTNPNTPIHLLQCENWIFAAYYHHGDKFIEPIQKLNLSETFKRYDFEGKAVGDAPGWELLAVELFESDIPDHYVSQGQYSSFNGQLPHVMSRTFAFEHKINGIGVTQTRYGITSKEIVVILENNQILGLHQKIVDAKRPIGPLTAEEKEEGAITYKPMVDYNSKDVLNYHLDVCGSNYVKSSPVSLESTSLVLVYGNDLFLTRRAPSKTFDVLSEDFNYLFLLSTIAILFISVLMAQQMNKS